LKDKDKRRLFQALAGVIDSVIALLKVVKSLFIKEKNIS